MSEVVDTRFIDREDLREAVKLLGFVPEDTMRLDITPERAVAHVRVRDENGVTVLNDEKNELLIETVTRRIVG